MKIRQKILLYFSTVTITLVGLALWFIYTLFAGYREEEFQKRQKEKISFTLHFLTEMQKADQELIETIDRITLNHLIDEKLLIFNKKKELIYSSIDDTPIPYSKSILANLSSENNWIEKKEKLYDVIGVYIRNLDKDYYGICKAYDTFGYTKLNYLKKVLVATFFGISFTIILVSFYLSKRITQPIVDITGKIHSYEFVEKFRPIETSGTNLEINVLAQQFNVLMKKMQDAFAYQKHAIHHISHELKTPVTVLVSNFERIEKETDLEIIRSLIADQKEDTKSLSEIINALLELSKVETGNAIKLESIRLDEMVFDISDELQRIYPVFQFSISYNQTEDESRLVVTGNQRLLKLALMNLMLNCIHYTNDNKARISFESCCDHLLVCFENSGKIISEIEKQYLFQHFFRGENSKGKRGFGLGLVFIHKIIALHGGNVSYSSPDDNLNLFSVKLPLS